MRLENGKIQLLEHEIEVLVNDSIWAENGMGRCSVKDLQILINDKMPYDMQTSVFIHELVHMIVDMNSIELTEQSIDGIALGILSFLKNNVYLVKEIMEDG